MFDLRPVQVGRTRITFDFFQAGNPIGTASVPMEIVAHEVEEAPEPCPAGLRREPAATPPDYMLFIAYERYADQPRLTFTLFRAGEVGRTFHPVKLEGDPQAHSAKLYERLTGMAANRSLPPEDVDRKLRAFGRNLWRDLIPDDLKAVYAAERLAWRGKSLLIVSDEPYFPWELVWPYDTGDVWQRRGTLVHIAPADALAAPRRPGQRPRGAARPAVAAWSGVPGAGQQPPT